MLAHVHYLRIVRYWQKIEQHCHCHCHCQHCHCRCEGAERDYFVMLLTLLDYAH